MDTNDFLHPDVIKGFNDAEKAGLIKEYNRFKQDCRKRSLDLASSRVNDFQRSGIFEQEIKDKDGKIQVPELLKEELLIRLADKYYAWLIKEI